MEISNLLESRESSASSKAAVAFLDCITANLHHHQDQIIIASMLEDLSGDSFILFLRLLKVVEISQKRRDLRFTADYDMKILTVLELIVTFKSAKYTFHEYKGGAKEYIR